MRNWPQTVPGASFKGFPFEVEREGLGGAGRFVAVHPYAKAETHDTEDTGRKPRRFRVTAYLVGDDADRQAQAFVDLCSSRGPGLLVLPITSPVEVRCLDCSTSNSKSEQGRVAFELEFIEKGADGAGAFPAIALGDRIAQSALDALPQVVGDALASIPIG